LQEVGISKLKINYICGVAKICQINEFHHPGQKERTWDACAAAMSVLHYATKWKCYDTARERGLHLVFLMRRIAPCTYHILANFLFTQERN
jgi:hypothetical protein